MGNWIEEGRREGRREEEREGGGHNWNGREEVVETNGREEEEAGLEEIDWEGEEGGEEGGIGEGEGREEGRRRGYSSRVEV